MRKDGAQHASAVHGERRQQIEPSQNEIGKGNAIGQIGVGRLNQRKKIDRALLRIKEREDEHRDKQVDRGPGERDPEFFPGLGRTFQTRHAADGIHDNLNGANTVKRADKGVAEFVQQHRCDHRHHEQRVISGRLITAETDHYQTNKQ